LGTLYVVATPIGNLEDISARALRILSEVTLIAAEDTRHTRKLLSHFRIDTPMVSYHAFNERSRREQLLAALGTGDVALVSDAGTPGISDPGTELVDAVLGAGFDVRAVPGASSLGAAASVSGLLTGPFTFLGFLPRKATERRLLIGRARGTGFGVVLFESPGRLRETMLELSKSFEGRRFAVVRELSKLHEEIHRGMFAGCEALEQLEGLRGELVIVIEPGQDANDDDPDVVIRGLLGMGMKVSDAARETARITGLPRSELYRRAMDMASKENNALDGAPSA
jgi:16S rRNA (cytidine1402-2'-O)-methyltransferase